ncbi:MAG: YfhO family protein [Bacilli bacterium]
MEKVNTIANSAILGIESWAKKLIKRLFVKPSWAVKTCYLLIVVGILCFGYTWINHDFTVPLGGDYNLQEMTFLYNGYDDWHQFFATGSFPQWDRSSFLGIDNVGGNSFYYLFDPFLLILLPFPRTWLLQLQGIEFVLKLALGGMFFYWYLGNFKLSGRVRMIGALAYGFSGYAFSYLWFHFIDSAAFFPLVLLGVERLIDKKDPRFLTVGYFLVAMSSYFFFVVFMFGGFFYWGFRYLQDIRRRKVNDNWAILGSSFIGFLVSVFLGCFVLIPGMVVAMSMPRVQSTSWIETIMNGETLSDKIAAFFTYSNNFSQLTPLYNFLFIPNSCFSSNILAVYWYDNFSASIYATTPMLLIFFVGLINSFKQKKISHFVGLLLTCFLVFTPLGFYLFSGFTVGYARYFIVPTAWLIAYDCITLEQRRKISRSYLDLAFVLVMAIDIIACVLDIWYVTKYSSFSNAFTKGGDWDIRILEIPISMAWCFICYLLMRPFFHKKKFHAVFTGLMAVDIIAMANIVIAVQGTVNLNNYMGGASNVAEETKIVELLKESELNQDFYRIMNSSATGSGININLREGYSGSLSSFHSVYPFGAQDFIDRSRLPFYYHDWEMASENRRYNLETFLGTKYYLVEKQAKSYAPYSIPKYTFDIPLGYVDILDMTEEERVEVDVDYSDELLDYLASDNCSKSLYVNKYFIDLGFSYDTVINEDWLYYPYGNNSSWGRYEDINEYPLLRYAMLENDDFNEFYDNKEYNAGTFKANGVTHTVNISSSTTSTANSFVNQLITTGEYEEGVSDPIEQISGSSRVQATVYAATRDELASNVNYGNYVYDIASDGTHLYYDDVTYKNESGNTYWTSDMMEWRNSHPFEVANNIYPGDTVYNYFTGKDSDGNYHENKVTYNTKIVYTPLDSNGKPTTICTKADPNDPNSGCYLSIQDSNNIIWRLYDSEDKIISSGKHTFHSNKYKRAHGYYADRPVSKIVGIVQEGTLVSPVSLQTPNIYVQRFSDYTAACDELKAYQPEITSRTEDVIQFRTNYDSKRFMVLNYPKQNGWKLYKKVANDETLGGYTLKEVTQYEANGGFIGFEAGSGAIEYVLEYNSPYLKLSGLVTGIGALITLFFLAFYGKKDKQRKNDNILSLHVDTQKIIQEEIWKYDDCEE